MEKSSFGQRLRIAFQNANNATIADKLGVGRSTVVNYLAGRIPEWPIVFKIKEVTGCDLDWLLTGEGELPSRAVTEPTLEETFERRMREIAREEITNLRSETSEPEEDYVEIEPAEMILAPVVAHIGPGRTEEIAKEEVRRMIGEGEIGEIERRIKPRKRRA